MLAYSVIDAEIRLEVAPYKKENAKLPVLKYKTGSFALCA
ncbi:hypothetical protein BOVA604_3467 [Bacteroides ovatus]|nr:hypothetical protein BOVA604_3467 [Bacteroides ovatus]